MECCLALNFTRNGLELGGNTHSPKLSYFETPFTVMLQEKKVKEKSAYIFSIKSEISTCRLCKTNSS